MDTPWAHAFLDFGLLYLDCWANVIQHIQLWTVFLWAQVQSTCLENTTNTKKNTTRRLNFVVISSCYQHEDCFSLVLSPLSYPLSSLPHDRLYARFFIHKSTKCISTEV
jgi:hypothetical protein